MVRVLNQQGIVPDFLCFQNRITLEEIKKHYGAELQLRFVNIPEPKLPFEWNIVAFNILVSKYLKAYNWAINSNNTAFGLKSPVPVLNYVHFPRKYRMRQLLRSVHFPEGPSKSLSDWANDPFKLLHFLYRFNQYIPKNGTTWANSQFTADCQEESYGIKPHQVVYPPVNEAEFPKSWQMGRALNTVISLGRFSPDKRQLEQIELAKLCPEFQFNLVGFVNNKAYFDRCKHAAEQTSNVVLHPNCEAQKRNELLQAAGIFLHSLRNEPFGITTAQALAEGCLPLVHNSGGQKEVVALNNHRYENLEEARIKLQEISKLNHSEAAKRLEILQKDLKSYSPTQFHGHFLRELKRITELSHREV